ncbi:DUF948 domain-containing protein [Bacillus massiliglaciei]|uniref:DUF948 domain-containing protein n=1 Tax=Bacillus massiliglaciei TaxID=1816693 RepID=UPI000DA61E1D|nr:DUF948 domain-containing protein [Bacillus massiliglaciei]
MIIVYASLAVIVGSLLYLGFIGFKTYKETKPSIDSAKETVQRMQAKAEQITDETDQLTKNQQEITEDIQVKKEKVQITIDAAKNAPKGFKDIWLAVKGEKYKKKIRREA